MEIIMEHWLEDRNHKASGGAAAAAYKPVLMI